MNTHDDLVLYELRNLDDEVRLVELVGDFADDDRLASGFYVRNLGAPAQYHAPSPSGVGIEDVLTVVDDSARGKIRSLHEIEEFFRFHGVRILVSEQVDERVHELSEVVRRYVRGHTNGDSYRSIEEEVRDARRQDARLFGRSIVVWSPIHGLFVDIGEQILRDLVHSGLGVSHRGGGVAVHRSEVSLSVHERIAHGKILSHADHGIVDGRVSVRVVPSEYVSHDTGGLAVLGPSTSPAIVHGVEDAAVYGLHSIAGVRQGSRDNDAHGVVEVARLHLADNGYLGIPRV